MIAVTLDPLRLSPFDSKTGKLLDEEEYEILNRWMPIIYPENTPVRDIVTGPFNALTACKDEETAADLKSAGATGKARGAFSFVLHEVLQGNPDIKMGAVEALVKEGIPKVSKHIQNPSYYAKSANSPVIG